MKTIEEARKRWDTLFKYGESIEKLRAATRSEEQGNPCEDGLRSVCWKAFLLFDNLKRAEWPQRLSDTRSGYSSLREHFLKYIKNPDYLQSAIDPLAEDEESPWQALRKDETTRAEIYQDVERCLQENAFFREPSTKSMMLDILFIYSKLNPDLGYRQGMHELLAPVLWALEEDAIIKESIGHDASAAADSASMLHILDADYIEHDAFSLFCSIMQVTRVYYEHSERKATTAQIDVAPIVSRCQYIHQELLMIVDGELASHLTAIEVLPQIFLTRWIRLLFGREFPFEEFFTMWDLLFADGLRLDLIDLVCIAMLLRIRWTLLEADYSTALTLLLRYPSPKPNSPQTLVHDALYLEHSLNPARGAFLISKYSGKPPNETESRRSTDSGPITRTRGSPRNSLRKLFEDTSPIRGPGRSNHKSLETLFQDVSEGLQRRTESWGVTKAVRGAVTEARRNISQPESGSPNSRPWYHNTARFGPLKSGLGRSINPITLTTKIEILEERNKTLATMLSDALHDLQAVRESTIGLHSNVSDTLNRAVSKIQTVQSSLEDSKPAEIVSEVRSSLDEKIESARSDVEKIPKLDDEEPLMGVTIPPSPVTSLKKEKPTQDPLTSVTTSLADKTEIAVPETSRPAAVRPSLAQSEFSWMLGDKTPRSSFVTSASLPPEQSRQGESRGKANPLFGDTRDHSRGRSKLDDGMVLSSLRGGRDSL